MSSSKVQFPSKANIISYLEQHSLTSKKTDPYLIEEGIIEAVATCFANQRKAPQGIATGVMLAMYDVNKKLELPEEVVKIINMSLIDALTDCANGKSIELEKTDGKTQENDI